MSKMEYVAVVGDDPTIVQHFFKNYLVTIGDPLTSSSWNLYNIVKHTKRLVNTKKPGHTLYLDSGGYQIIVGYVERSRVREFIESYHFAINKFKDKIDYVFSLDVNEPGKMSEKELYEFNRYSVEQSINLIEQAPQLQNKQLFVWQTRNPIVYKVWNTLYDELDIASTYRRWAFGGLVGFKTQAGASFSPFVPSFLDFMVKKKRDGLVVDQIHFLGQSSMLAIFTAALLQHIFNIKYVTLDSSELVRHTPLHQKLPLFHYNGDDARWCATIDDIEHLEENERQYINDTGRMLNSETFIKTMASHINSLFTFANEFIDEIYNDIQAMGREKFLSKWEPLKKGRFYDEFLNNINLVHKWLPLIESRAVEKSRLMYEQEILSQYKSF